MEMVGKPVMVGVTAAVASKFLFPGDDTIPVFGMEVSQMVAVGVAVGGASAIGGIASGYILPMLPQSEEAAKAEGMILTPAMTAAATYAVARMLGDVPNPFPLLALGAGSEIAGTYAWGIVGPMISGDGKDDAKDPKKKPVGLLATR